MIAVDAHVEVDASLSVEAGHGIAVEARNRVLQRHRVLKFMTLVDPSRRPDRDHAVFMPRLTNQDHRDGIQCC